MKTQIWVGIKNMHGAAASFRNAPNGQRGAPNGQRGAIMVNMPPIMTHKATTQLRPGAYL